MYNVDIGRHQISRSQYWLVGSAPPPSAAPASSALSSSHLAPCSGCSTSLTTISHASAIAPVAHLSAIAIAIIAIAAIAIGVHAIAAIAPVSASTATATSTAASPASLVLGCDLLYCQGMTIDRGLTLFDQLFCCLLPLKGDEGKVLWLVVLALVHRPDHLGHGAEGDKVGLDLLVGHPLGGKVAQVDLALLGLGLLASDFLSLDNMSLLAGGGLYPSAVLKQDEGESPGPSGIRVCLQVDVFNLSKLTKILLDIRIFGLLAYINI